MYVNDIFSQRNKTHAFRSAVTVHTVERMHAAAQAWPRVWHPLTPTTQLWINRPSISAVLDAPFYNNACDWSQARSSLFPHQTTARTCHPSCGVRARVYVYFLWNIDRYNHDIRKLYTKNNFIPSHCPAIVHIILEEYNTHAWLNNAKTNKYTYKSQ